MKKIRGIRTPLYEPKCRYICIDEFENIEKAKQLANGKDLTYYCGLHVYLDDYQKELFKSGSLRFRGYDPIGRHEHDIFEPPTIEMYIKLGEKLKEEGLIFNKKTGNIIIKNKIKG